MTEESETNDMLEAISKGLEPRTPCSQAIIGRDMSDKDCLFSLSFHVSENTLQPSELITGVREYLPEVPVLVIASLSGHSKHPGVVEEFLIGFAFQLEVLSVVACLAESLNGLLIKPEVPDSSQILNHVVLRT